MANSPIWILAARSKVVPWACALNTCYPQTIAHCVLYPTSLFKQFLWAWLHKIFVRYAHNSIPIPLSKCFWRPYYLCSNIGNDKLSFNHWHAYTYQLNKRNMKHVMQKKWTKYHFLTVWIWRVVVWITCSEPWSVSIYSSDMLQCQGGVVHLQIDVWMPYPTSFQAPQLFNVTQKKTGKRSRRHDFFRCKGGERVTVVRGC